jgi:hypothetical protein
MGRAGKKDLLVEINGGGDEAETVRNELVRFIGLKVTVTEVEDSAVIELRDFDEVQTRSLNH